MGQSAGLIFGAFGALIGALAGYMAATRKQRPAQQGDQTIIATNVKTVTQPQPVVEPEPAPPVVKPKPKPKSKR